MEDLNVNDFIDYLPSFVSLLSHECENSMAGRVANYASEWKSLTNEPDVISNLSGLKIERDLSLNNLFLANHHLVILISLSFKTESK